MKRITKHLYLGVLFISLAFVSESFGAPPTITSFSPISGPVGTSVTISGTNFSATPASNIVFFGGTQAVVTSATTTQLTVTVPSGATYSPITVSVGGLTAYSTTSFMLTFPGGGNIDASTFTPKVDFPTAANPWSISIADFDGDGKPDLAAADNGASRISVLRNTSLQANLNFTSIANPLPTGNNPHSVASGDFDGDGKMDLVTANINSANVTVYRNISAGNLIDFASRVDFTTGAGANSVAVGDIDGDGKPDLAVSNFNGNSISVLQNTSAGAGSISFADKVDYPIGVQPYWVSLGDLDGDGKPDLASANNGSNTISLLRNTSVPGSISIAAKIDLTTASSPRNVSIGDFDGDGRPDLAVPNANSNSISIFLSRSTPGSFNFAPSLEFGTAPGPIATSIGDLDGDGKADLAVVNNLGFSVSAFRNISPGPSNINFAQYADFIAGSVPIGLAIGDLDGDGKSDMIVSNSNANTLSVYRHTQPAVPTITGFTPLSGAVGTTVTISGTGFNPLIPSNTIVYFGGAKATVVSVTPTSIVATVPKGSTYEPISVTSLSTGLTGFSRSSFDVTFSPGGTLDVNSFDTRVNFAVGTQPYGMVSADLDLDGKPDLAVPNTNTANTISVLRNNSTPGVINNTTLNTNVLFSSGNNTAKVELADIDGDGKKDMLETNYGDNTLSVFRNIAVPGSIGATSFASRISFTTGSNPSGLAVNDIDMDGKPDVIVVNSQSPFGVSVFKNTSSVGNINFAPKVDFPFTSQGFYVKLRDLDGDGKPEIIVGPAGGGVSIFKNTSTTGVINSTSFSNAVAFPVGGFARDFDIGDIDSDGKLDIIVPVETNSTFAALRNLSFVGTIAFNSAVNFPTVANPSTCEIGDIDGDGKPDVVIVGVGANTAQAFKNLSAPGSFAFGTGISFTLGNAPFNPVLVDIDGDGKPEICAPNFNDNTISILQNKVGQIPPTITSFTPTSAAAGSIVTITGANFTGVIDVSFGATKATSFTVLSSTTITAVVAGGIAGSPVSISVITSGGTATAPGFTFMLNQSINYVFGDHVVISEIFGGGGNSGSPFANDFVELYNPTGSAVNLNGWSIQYASATGTFNNKVDLTGSIPSGQFYLIQLASNGFGAPPLPPPNISSNAINMAQGSGKVALCSSIAPISGITSAAVVDFVGYGAIANSFEGSGPTPDLSSSTSVERKASSTSTAPSLAVGGPESLAGNGFDSNNNAVDFLVRGIPQPQNSSTQETPPLLGFTPKSAGNVFPINGLATSGLPITYRTSNPTVATISGIVVRVVGPGSTTITASQSGNAAYLPAPDVSQVLTVSRGNQTILLGPLPPKIFGDSAFQLPPIASSGLIVIYGSFDPTVATVSGNIVTIVGAGTTTIVANQPGNASYNPAPTVQQVLNVAKATQTITFDSLADHTLGDADFVLSATATSGLPVTFASTNPAVAVINGDTVTLIDAGTTTITASQPGNSNYIAAANVVRNLVVHTPRSVIESDSLALVSFYNATNGGSWSTNTNWLTGPVNTWNGITVQNQRVTELSFINNNLDGILPPEIGNLSELTNMQIWFNHLTSLPDEIGNLHHLQRLSFSGNPLSGIIPNSIFQITSLEFLDCGSVGLTSLPPTIGNLTNLKTLQMGSNQVTSLPDELTHLSNLQSLTLNSNPISELPANFGALTNLQLLDIGYLPLHHFPSEILNFTNLSYLAAYGIGAIDIPAEIGNLSKLSFVQLFSNSIQSLPSSLSNLNELYWFDVSSNQLGDVPVGLASLPKLRVLILQSNRLDFGDIEPFLAIPTFLYANQAKIPGGGPLSVDMNAAMDLSFSVGGTANVYQWYKDSNLISGAQSNPYLVPSAQLADAGEYYLQVTNTLAPLLTLESERYQVTLIALPTMQITGPGGVIPNYHPSLYNVDYSFTDVGSSFPLNFTIKNTGNGALNIDSATVSGPNGADFHLTLPSLPLTIAAGDSVVFTIAFVPTDNGFRTGKISFKSNDPNNNPYEFSLSGTGANATRIIQLSGTLDFGAVPLRTLAARTATLKNLGTSPLTLNSIQSPKDYFIALKAGTSLAPGDSIPFNVYYSPSTGETSNGFLKLVSNATSGVDSIAVTGSGVSPIVITSVYPSYGMPGDTIAIVGRGFSFPPVKKLLEERAQVAAPAAPAEQPAAKKEDQKLPVQQKPGRSSVFFNGIGATLITHSADTAFVVIPVGASDGRILVENLPYEALSPQIFKVTSPHPTVFSAKNLSDGHTIDSVRSNYDGVSVDIDSDGRPDLVTANYQDGSVSFFRNATQSDSIVFDKPVIMDFSPFGNPRSIVAQDINGNGVMDFVIAFNSGRYLATVMDFAYGPKGQLLAKIDLGADGAQAIAVDDLDRDGNMEIIATTGTGKTVVIISTDPKGNATTLRMPVGNTVFNVKTGDLDGDGRPEIILANYELNGVTVLRNSTVPGKLDSASFAIRSDYSTGPNPLGLDLADLDGDGKTDIIAGNVNDLNVSVLYNVSFPGAMVIANAQNFPGEPGGNTNTVRVTDLSGDGKPEILFGHNSTNSVMPVFPNASPVFGLNLKSKVEFPMAGYPTGFAVADFNADSLEDVIALSSNLQSLTVFNGRIAPLVQAPTVPASNITFANVFSTTMTVNFTKGNGAKRLVFINTWSPVNIEPNDDVAFLVDQTYGSNRLVLNDTTSSVIITNLQPSTNYFVTVYEYNQAGSLIRYLIPGAPVAQHGTLPLPNVYVTTPADGAIDRAVTLNVTSKLLTGATTYTIELNDSSNFLGNSFIKSGARTQNFTLSYSKRYYTRVKTNLSPDYGPVTTFNTLVADIYATAPADGAVNQAISLNVTSKALTGAVTYTIELSDSANFNGVSMIKSGTRTQNFTGLAYATRYYVRVKTDNYPYFGRVTSFTTAVPNILVITPADGAVNQAINLNVTAKALTGATVYTIELNDSSDFSGTTLVMAGARTQRFTGLAYAKTYYARVKTDIYPHYGTVTSFTTAVPNVYITTPADGAVGQAIKLNLTATALTGAVAYTIELNDSANFQGSFSIVKSGSRTQNFAGLSYAHTYYTRVKTDIYPYYGQVNSFSTSMVPFPSITSPVDGATNVSWVVNLTASSIAGASQYTIEVDTDSAFTTSPIVKMGTGTSRTISFSLAKDQRYFVRAKTDLDPGWGIIQQFTTGDALSLAYVINPANQQTDVPTTTNVVANAVPGARRYTISLSLDSLFAGPAVTVTSTSRTVSFSNLNQASTYYSRVSTDLTPGLWGQTRSFMTLDPNARTTGRQTVTQQTADEIIAESFAVSVFPNPFKEKFQFHAQSLEQEPIGVKLIDMNGKIVLESSEWMTNSMHEVGGEFSAGIYFLVVQKGNEQKVVKMIRVE